MLPMAAWAEEGEARTFTEWFNHPSWDGTDRETSESYVAAVAASLGRAPEDWITKAELAAFTGRVDLRDVNLADDDLSNCTHLTNLELLTGAMEVSLPDKEGIADIAFAASMPNLRSLEASGNAISDLSPLARCAQLQELYLDGNNVHDLTPLAALSRLRTLWLGNNDLEDEDLGALSALGNLTDLLLGGNRLSDLTPLAGLTELTVLELWWNEGLVDVGPLGSLTKLEFLDLEGNGIKEVSALNALTSLKELNLGCNQIDDHAVLSRQLPALLEAGTEIFLYENPIPEEHTLERHVVAANCVEEGYAEDRCPCGYAENYEALPVDPLAHAFGAWQVAKPATADEDGLEVRVCNHDGTHKQSRAIPRTGGDAGDDGFGHSDDITLTPGSVEGQPGSGVGGASGASGSGAGVASGGASGASGGAGGTGGDASAAGSSEAATHYTEIHYYQAHPSGSQSASGAEGGGVGTGGAAPAGVEPAVGGSGAAGAQEEAAVAPDAVAGGQGAQGLQGLQGQQGGRAARADAAAIAGICASAAAIAAGLLILVLWKRRKKESADDRHGILRNRAC
jgi:hypothetical protein